MVRVDAQCVDFLIVGNPGTNFLSELGRGVSKVGKPRVDPARISVTLGDPRAIGEIGGDP